MRPSAHRFPLRAMGGRGPGEQDGRLLEPPDASINAKSNDEKNHRAVEVRIPRVFDAPESGLYRYAQSGLELAHRDILRSAAVRAKRTWRTSSQGLWVHGLERRRVCDACY